MGQTISRWTWMSAVAAVALPLAMTACDDGDITVPGGSAQMSVFLTDAPGDVEAVWVEIEEIYLQGGDGRVDLLGEPTEMVLLTDLVGTAQLLSANVEVDPTLYGQLRLVVGDALLLSTDGVLYVKGEPEIPVELEEAERGVLQCPSCSQSGLKVIVPNDEVEVAEGLQAVVVDFDVAESFGHPAGNSDRWNMRPVIHGTLVTDENGDGSLSDELDSVSDIHGMVQLDTDVVVPECPAGSPRSVADFVPQATTQTLMGPDGPIVRTGSVAADGSFTISFLAPDGYDLGYMGTLDLGDMDLVFTATVNPPSVTVSTGDVGGVVYTIETADCEPG